MWRRLPNTPRTMLYPQSVTVDTAVYIADRGYPTGVILRYNPHTNKFTELAEYLVAGGCDDSGTDIATVEILNTSVSHSQWLSATPLPVSCRLMSAAIIYGTLYLLGGTLRKQVLSVSLPALIQTDKLPAQWRTLPDAPLERFTAAVVRGYLLAVGGSHGRQRSSAILVYDQDKNAWNKVGGLPTKRQDCACCLLPSGEILVAGGDVGNYNWTRRMDVADNMERGLRQKSENRFIEFRQSIIIRCRVKAASGGWSYGRALCRMTYKRIHVRTSLIY